MKTYFIRGLECTAHIGPNNWQKSVSQKLNIDIEWQSTADPNASSLIDTEIIIKNIIELTSSKHWQALDELGEQIKHQIQAQLNIDHLQLSICIPHAYSHTKSVGITLNLS